eukprot:gnl/MRDRNA2_/MRDRNA2_75317_c0_seq1.p1 gnl/MRDRNA2_/MRDRNA2_75317_c0~~gnl/MRDRNA2_/MRDRNA2_75317_c0_seq1.p1  ORF type:complete len:648 (+),score=108.97 gnl/MRDRNA2_/MRDRNA2_75317_c0_seq1:66-2009(+)
MTLDAAAGDRVTNDGRLFCGVVKSYNARRGFGFLACDETAKIFGRDVYLSKEWAVENGNSVDEGDYVMFAVAKSDEGFPKATQLQQLQRLRGEVLHFSVDAGGAISCPESNDFFGGQEIFVGPSDCGRLLLVKGDHVDFCIEHIKGGGLRARMVSLVKTVRPHGSMLSCFTLELPHKGGDDSERKVYKLPAHAFGGRLCLGGVAETMTEEGLLAFFARQGGSLCKVQHSGACSGFASLTFPNPDDLLRFLVLETAAFTEKCGDTVLVKLTSTEKSDFGALPAASPPRLIPLDGRALRVEWDKVAIAAAYIIELRNLRDEAAQWCVVDPQSGQLRNSSETHDEVFGAGTFSCIAMGLMPGSSYEARLTYRGVCGCKASKSALSAACSVDEVSQQTNSGSRPPARPLAAPQGIRQTVSLSNAVAQAPPNVSQGLPGTLPPAMQSGLRPQGVPQGLAAAIPAMVPAPMPQVLPSAMPAGLPANSTALAPMFAPGLWPSQACAASLTVSWQPIAAAAAYSVELRQEGACTGQVFDVFAGPGCSTELVACGLDPGRRYAASVRYRTANGQEAPQSELSRYASPAPPALLVVAENVLEASTCSNAGPDIPATPSPMSTYAQPRPLESYSQLMGQTAGPSWAAQSCQGGYHQTQ